MTDTNIGETAAIPKVDEWAERIAAQQRSGNSVKQFCKEQGVPEGSFYAWRKRLQKREPVRFALVDRGAAQRELATKAALDWSWRPVGGCASAPEWTPLPCARCWKFCGRDPSAGQRAGVSVPDSMRHAQEF
jgi:hypothetical protein